LTNERGETDTNRVSRELGGDPLADGNDGRRVPSSVVGALVAEVLPDLGTPAAVLEILQVSGRGVLHSYSSCESLLWATAKYFVVDSAALFR